MKVIRLLVSVVAGVIVTLLTGLIRNTPAMWVGATHYGYPLAWLVHVVAARQYNPWDINLFNFFADVVAWSIVAIAVVLVIEKMRK